MKIKSYVFNILLMLAILPNVANASGTVALNLKILNENGAPISGAVVWYRPANATGRAWSSGLPDGYEVRRSNGTMAMCSCWGSEIRQDNQCNYSGPSLHPEDYFSNVRAGQEYAIEIRITKEGYQEIKDSYSWKASLNDLCIYRTYILKNLNINRSIPAPSSNYQSLPGEIPRALIELIGPSNCQYAITYVNHMRIDHYKDYEFYSHPSLGLGESIYSIGKRILAIDLNYYLREINPSEIDRIPTIVDCTIAPGNNATMVECFLIPGKKTVIRIDETGNPLSVEYI